ncbi:MAG: NHL repeat-containing protein [Planctomycetota bacterium]|jgi:DNA-binding beta-propeller fold protein YncE
MKKLTALALLAAFCMPLSADEMNYDFVAGWLKGVDNNPQLGNMHGEIAVDSKGRTYVSVQNENAGIQVYNKQGKHVKTLEVPPGFHGFVIHRDADGQEFIYASDLVNPRILKMTLAGKIAIEIPASRIPEKFWGQRNGKPSLRLTSVDVAPNGDIFVVDGYGIDYIHQFTASGQYVKSFGGRVPPLNLMNCHKIFVDTRYDKPRLLLCDRINLRLVHADLDGNLIGVYATDLRRPSSAAFWGDYVAIAEIAGRVSVYDKNGKMVAALGANDGKGLNNTNRVKPEQWIDGKVNSPHGIAFDQDGNILVAEWNVYGRVNRFDRVK